MTLDERKALIWKTLAKDPEPLDVAGPSGPASSWNNPITGGSGCALCLGEGRVPVFEDRDGVRMPAGYRPCDCVEEE